MGALRPVKPIKLLKILQKYYGYYARQGKGDHIVLSDSRGHHTVIQSAPKELRPQMVKMILHETELTWEDIEKYL